MTAAIGAPICALLPWKVTLPDLFVTHFNFNPSITAEEERRAQGTPSLQIAGPVFSTVSGTGML